MKEGSQRGVLLNLYKAKQKTHNYPLGDLSYSLSLLASGEGGFH